MTHSPANGPGLPRRARRVSAVENLVPTLAQQRELTELLEWARLAPPVEALADHGADIKLINALHRNDMHTLVQLYPVYRTVTEHIVDGQLPNKAWTTRATWLPRQLHGIGQPKLAQIVATYQGWSTANPQQAASIATVRRPPVGERARLCALAFLEGETDLVGIGSEHGISAQRVRQELEKVGLYKDLRELHRINLSWARVGR